MFIDNFIEEDYNKSKAKRFTLINKARDLQEEVRLV
jgi:hypothetical protein